MTDKQATKEKAFRNKMVVLLRRTATRREGAPRSYMTLDELADRLHRDRSDFSKKINGEMTRDEVEAVIEELARVEAIKRRSQARELFALRDIYEISSDYWHDEAFKSLKNDDPSESDKPKEQPAVPATEHTASEGAAEPGQSEARQAPPTAPSDQKVPTGKSVNRKELMQTILWTLGVLVLLAILIVAIVMLAKFWPAIMGS